MELTLWPLGIGELESEWNDLGKKKCIFTLEEKGKNAIHFEWRVLRWFEGKNLVDSR